MAGGDRRSVALGVKSATFGQIFDEKFEKVLAEAELEGPVEPDNPYLTFETLIEVGAEMRRRAVANDSYYTSGRCGGCEICGDQPYPTITPQEWGEYRRLLNSCLVKISEEEAKRNAGKTPFGAW